MRVLSVLVLSLALLALLNLVSSQEQSMRRMTPFSASSKRDAIWGQVTQTDSASGSWPSTLEAAGIFLEDLGPTGNWNSDQMPSGRKKLIHSVGVVAKARFDWTNNLGYTGFFSGSSASVILRLSCAAEPGYSGFFDKVKSMVPGLAVKHFRDGTIPSGNFMAMWDLAGQEDFNFFLNPFSNHVQVRSNFSLQLKLLSKKFQTVDDNPNAVGLGDLATYNEDGSKVSSPNLPFTLVFQPNPTLTAAFDGTDNDDFVTLIENYFKGNEELYKIYAIAEPGSTKMEFLGYLRLDSAFHRTSYGDTGLFFRHEFMEKDFDRKPDWKKTYSSNNLNTKDGAPVLGKYLPAY